MSLLRGKNLLSAKDLTLPEINEILETAKAFLPIARKEKTSNLLQGKLVAALFYEPSTRTRLSFEAAMLRLGGQIMSVIGMEHSSLKKGETLHDTAKVIGTYADVIVMRHALPGSVGEFARDSGVPVLNAGDGASEHPTQALLDLFTIQQERGRLNGLTVAMIGDLKFGRTVHSLSYLLAHFEIKLILVSPHKLRMPREIVKHLSRKMEITEISELEPALKKADVVYMTRIQQERFVDAAEYDRFKNSYVLTRALVKKFCPRATIMHPLPRVGEIARDLDDLPGAAYFRQVQNGVAMRMALLALVLGAN